MDIVPPPENSNRPQTSIFKLLTSGEKQVIGLIVLVLAISAVAVFWMIRLKSPTSAPTGITDNNVKNSTDGYLSGTKIEVLNNASLPTDFPAEFLVDNQNSLAAAESNDQRTTAIFLTKLSAKEFVDTFTASIEAKGWEVVVRNGDDTNLGIVANKSGSNPVTGSVHVRATELPEGRTSISIAYYR